jgi:hypothetical protein
MPITVVLSSRGPQLSFEQKSPVLHRAAENGATQSLPLRVCKMH